jgi:hypothetical protein
MNDTNYAEWTSCEFYGHQFEEGRCTDCGEKNEDFENEK